MAQPVLAAGRTLLSSIRYQARLRADRWMNGATVTPTFPDAFRNSFITTDELDLYLNASAGELYELLCVQYSNYWQTAAYVLTCDGVNEQFALPQNMLKHLSTEWVASPALTTGPSGANTVNTNNTNNTVLQRFNLNDRDVFSYSGFSAPPVYGAAVCRYSVFGSSIWFKPLPPGGTVMQILHVPVPVPLVDSASITMNTVVAGNTLTITATVNGVSTAYVFTAIAFGGSPTSAQFVVGGETASNLGDAGTAASLMDALNDSGLGGLAGVLVAYNDASTLAGTQVQLCLTNPVIITWTTSGATLVLDPNQSTDAYGTVIGFSNVMTGYAGLEEYLVVDAAIKMKQKGEDDCSLLMAQKLALIARYKDNYSNRDPGQPRTATDSKRRGAWTPWGRGGGLY